ncbi:EamA-like transporter family protein [Amycolatopsis sacchari]|uniref:EamA-like transporter family protein n=1 Tax=Amycolatopsis sacchari TaxID=115433 RepID=A0A1I3YWV5_9PSEU|nr:DMT family transporter [Amycolatopsis sacchari]SFK36250.1 EamA-like transporter family protein [Amycolatopsis sacchari]
MHSIRTALPGAAAMAFVGGSVTVSGSLGDAPLFTTQAIRYAIAFVILLALARATGHRILLPRGREWLWLAGVAASGLVLFNVALVRGGEHAEPAVIAVAVACVPVLLGLVGPLLQGQRPHRRILLAAVVVTVGSVLVEGTGRTDAAGVAWAAVALLCEAGFTLLAVPVLGRHGAWGVSLHSVWLGAVMFALLGAAEEDTLPATGTEWAAIAYLAVLVTAAAFLLWYSTVARLGPGRSGLLTGIAPVAAALTGGDLPGPLVWTGIAVVAAGLAVGLVLTRAGTEPSVARTGGP